MKIPTNVENLFYGQPLAKYGCYSPGSPHSFGGPLKEKKGKKLSESEKIKAKIQDINELEELKVVSLKVVHLFHHMRYENGKYNH